MCNQTTKLRFSASKLGCKQATKQWGISSLYGAKIASWTTKQHDFYAPVPFATRMQYLLHGAVIPNRAHATKHTLTSSSVVRKGVSRLCWTKFGLFGAQRASMFVHRMVLKEAQKLAHKARSMWAFLARPRAQEWGLRGSMHAHFIPNLILILVRSIERCFNSRWALHEKHASRRCQIIPTTSLEFRWVFKCLLRVFFGGFLV
jgi:hypothetical protein